MSNLSEKELSALPILTNYITILANYERSFLL